MKTAVIFYSLEGNVRYLAEGIAKELQAELVELKTKKEFPTSGFKKYFWGGKSVVLKEKPVLTNTDLNIEQYDNIILGTPIWAGTYAAPFNTFVKKYKFAGKKVAVYACNAGGGVEKCFKSFKEALPENEFVGEIEFVDPLKKNKEENLEKVINWVKTLRF